MKKIASVWVVLVWVCAACAASGNAPERTTTASAPAEKAQSALDALRQAYTERDEHAFFEQVSSHPSFALENLKFDVSKRFHEFSQIDWNIVTDSVVSNGANVSVKTHWQKRMQNNSTGLAQKSEGSTEFIFSVHKQAKLAGFKGDSPF